MSHPGNGDLRDYQGPSLNATNGVVQVELGLGKNAVILVWLSCAVSAVAVVALLFTMFELKTLSAKYEVLQYDHQALKAQLVARGLYEATEH